MSEQESFLEINQWAGLGWLMLFMLWMLAAQSIFAENTLSLFPSHVEWQEIRPKYRTHFIY